MEPHEVDVIALALIAVGIFFGGVAYFGWAGGSVGHGSVGALRFLVGALAYAVPVVLVIAGRPDPRAGIAPAGASAAHGCDLSDGGTLARARRGHAWHRPRRRAGAAFLVRGHDQATGRNPRRRRVLGGGAHVLDGGRRHPRGLPRAHRDPAPQRRNLRLGRAGRPAQRRRRAARAEIAQATRRVTTQAGRDLGGEATRPPPRRKPWPTRWTEGGGVSITEFVVRRTHVEAPAVDAEAVPELGEEPDREADQGVSASSASKRSRSQVRSRRIPIPPTTIPIPRPPPPAKPKLAAEPELDPSDLTPQGRFRASVTDDPTSSGPFRRRVSWFAPRARRRSPTPPVRHRWQPP